MIPDPQLQSMLVSELETLFNEYQKASSLKRPFIVGSLRKKLVIVAKEHNLTWVMFLRIVFTAWRLKLAAKSTKKLGQPVSDEFLLKIFPEGDKGFVYVFQFLACVFDYQAPEGDKEIWFRQITHVFEFLYRDHNEPLFADNAKLHIHWDEPGVPCLLEAFIMLISAEKTRSILRIMHGRH